jgi:hypothetical protein
MYGPLQRGPITRRDALTIATRIIRCVGYRRAVVCDQFGGGVLRAEGNLPLIQPISLFFLCLRITNFTKLRNGNEALNGFEPTYMVNHNSLMIFSYLFDLPSGARIILVGVFSFFLVVPRGFSLTSAGTKKPGQVTIATALLSGTVIR